MLTIILPILAILHTAPCLEIPESNGEHVECARSKIDRNVTVSAGHQAGSFLKANKSIATMEKCVQQCCQMSGCDVAFFSNDACYSVICKDVESCAPAKNTNARMNIEISYVAKPNIANKKSYVTDKTGEPAITDNLISEVTKESPFLFDEPNSTDEDDTDLQLMRSRRESWKETKDMVIAITCGFVAVAVGVAGVIMMTRQLVEDDDIFIDFGTEMNFCEEKTESTVCNSEANASAVNERQKSKQHQRH
ncbi:uncharacterized protein LOC130654054 [Hydractinia symbiolongicarpus]|uniref:uncharacterized protein LOC130654054 n=1 Tax=Hydractinia symbiolongicarpus TaxID=13093 RepID=UPI00254BE501|nr:uncharacterized protein LOC130654054 [Hydractinia symbiolongicarpus]